MIATTVKLSGSSTVDGSDKVTAIGGNDVGGLFQHSITIPFTVASTIVLIHIYIYIYIYIYVYTICLKHLKCLPIGVTSNTIA